MKRIFKIVPCLLLSALTLVGACACRGGVSDLRRRARRLQEQQLEPRQEQILTDDELDPDFLVEAETDDSAQGEQSPDGNECPDCPKPHRDFHHHGGHRPPRHGGRKHTQTLPCPVPDEEQN